MLLLILLAVLGQRVDYNGNYTTDYSYPQNTSVLGKNYTEDYNRDSYAPENYTKDYPYMQDVPTAGVYCEAGFFLEGTSCKPCPAGFTSFQEMNVCIACAAGKTSATEGSPYCYECPPGKTSHPGMTTCFDCAAGKVSDGGSPACIVCPAGKFSVVGSNMCELCWAGSYSDNGATTCHGKEQHTNETSSYPHDIVRRRNWWSDRLLNITCSNQPKEEETCDESKIYCIGYCKIFCAKGLLLTVEKGNDTELQCVSCDSDKELVSTSPPTGGLICSDIVEAHWDQQDQRGYWQPNCESGWTKGRTVTVHGHMDVCLKQCEDTVEDQSGITLSEGTEPIERNCTIEVSPTRETPEAKYLEWESEEYEKLWGTCCPHDMTFQGTKRWKEGNSPEGTFQVCHKSILTRRRLRRHHKKGEERDQFEAPRQCRFDEQIYDSAF